MPIETHNDMLQKVKELRCHATMAPSMLDPSLRESRAKRMEENALTSTRTDRKNRGVTNEISIPTLKKNPMLFLLDAIAAYVSRP